MTDGGTIKNGRAIVYAPECPLAWAKGSMPRARYVLWAAGVEIPPSYVVHHKDENKLNDSLDNLEVLYSPVHRRLHTLGNTFGRANKGKLLGFKHSDETRAKLSATHKGKPKSEEWRAAISRANLGVPKTCKLCGARGSRKTHPNHPQINNVRGQSVRTHNAEAVQSHVGG